MNQIVPPGFLFRWSFTAKKIDKLPRATGRLLDLPEECLLPSLGELDQQADFARIKLAWNEKGFGVSVEVTGRKRPLEIPRELTGHPDAVSLWFDTRNTQTIHRATRFCHQFLLHPAGSGLKRAHPSVRAMPVARAREESALPNAELVKIQAGTTDTGYWIDAWFPREVFVGYEPENQTQMGFYYLVHDSELGDQTLSAGREFPFESDPSLWHTVELGK